MNRKLISCWKINWFHDRVQAVDDDGLTETTEMPNESYSFISSRSLQLSYISFASVDFFGLLDSNKSEISTNENRDERGANK